MKRVRGEKVNNPVKKPISSPANGLKTATKTYGI